MRAALLAAAAAACSDPGLDDRDAAADAATLKCPRVAPPQRPVSVLPTGGWWGTWTCMSGCDLPAPSMTGGTRLEIGVGADSRADWRTEQGETLDRTPLLADGDCWASGAVDDGCRAAFDLCGVDCAGEQCVTAPLITWTDLATGRQQQWSFNGDRFLPP